MNVSGVKKAAAKKRKSISRRRLSGFFARFRNYRLPFAVRWPFLIYLAIFFFALVFTQALSSPLSSILFVMVMLIPIFSLLYIFLCFPAFKVSVDVTKYEIPKRTPTSFRILLTNESPLPLPFAELELLLPSSGSAVRCVERIAAVSLAPFGHCELQRDIEFYYRGQYTIGVRRAYIYDPFRMFRIVNNAVSLDTVFVTPRRLTIPGNSDISAFDIDADSSKHAAGIDRSDIADMRDYRIGDHMKDIHWKLSTKKEDLVTREFTMDAGKTFYIFVDMAPLSAVVTPESVYRSTGVLIDTDEANGNEKNNKVNPIKANRKAVNAKQIISEADEHGSSLSYEFYEDDINEYAADGVIELAVAMVLRELRSGNSCTMFWYDNRADGGIMSAVMQNPHDLDRFFKTFSTVGLLSAEEAPNKRFTSLTALIEETHAVAMLFITAALTETFSEELTGIASVYGSVFTRGAVEVCLFEPSEKVTEGLPRDSFIDHYKRCSEQLMNSGINVFSTTLGSIDNT